MVVQLQLKGAGREWCVGVGCPLLQCPDGTVGGAVAARHASEYQSIVFTDQAEVAGAVAVALASVEVFDAARPVWFSWIAADWRCVDASSVGHPAGVPAWVVVFGKRLVVGQFELCHVLIFLCGFWVGDVVASGRLGSSGADKALCPKLGSRRGCPGRWQVQKRWTSWFLS